MIMVFAYALPGNFINAGFANEQYYAISKTVTICKLYIKKINYTMEDDIDYE